MVTATSAMWTLLRLFTAKSNLLIPSSEHVNGLIQLARTPLSDALKANSIGMLGIVGQLPHHTALIAEIGKLLLDSLQDKSALVVAESLNSIFDIFAEVNYNQIVKNIEMMRILESFVPHLKNKVKSEKRTVEHDVWNRLDDSRINLVRFIKYKKTQF